MTDQPTRDEVHKFMQALSNPELTDLWRKAHRAGAMGALAHVENELIRRVRVMAKRAKGGPGSGNWGHTSIRRLGQVGGSDPGGGLGALGLEAGATIAQRREAAQGRRGKTGYAVEKTSRWTWELENGVTVTALSVTDPRWGKHGYYSTHQIAEIKVGDQTVRVLAEHPWVRDQDNPDRRMTGRRLTAQDRDTLMEEVIIPTLQEVPAAHLDKLERLHFNPLVGGAEGQYHPFPEEDKFHGADGFVEVLQWNQYYDYGGGAMPLRAIMRHEIGHHVWGSVLNEQERRTYARAIGVPDSLQTDYHRGPPKWEAPELHDRVKATLEYKIEPTPTMPKMSCYGATNVWEDFADWYKATDSFSGRVNHRYDGMFFWDTAAAKPAWYEFTDEAVSARAKHLPMGKLRG